jgi:nucleotide-binding universal stress UspA family protein
VRGAPLRLLFAYGWGGGGRSHVAAARDQDVFVPWARDCLREAAAQAQDESPGIDVTTEMVTGQPVDLLTQRSPDVELVVLGSRGLGGLSGLLLGSVAVGVVSHARCPVVVVRGDSIEHPLQQRDHDPAAPVVVGLDGSPTSEAALAFAFDWATRHAAPLVAVHAWTDVTVDPAVATLLYRDDVREEESRLLAEQLAGWGEKYPDVAVQRVLAPDRAAHALLERSETARLLVVGARGRGGMAGLLLGSTSQALLHRAGCPVAVIHQQR